MGVTRLTCSLAVPRAPSKNTSCRAMMPWNTTCGHQHNRLVPAYKISQPMCDLWTQTDNLALAQAACRHAEQSAEACFESAACRAAK